jgi:diguanylate cyclase (GGDEF)-like protein/PAS domain S-box-containing protein
MSLTILLIQDDPEVAASVMAALRSSGDPVFKVEWVRNCSEAVARLGPAATASPAIDAVLSAMDLPDSRGIRTFDQLFRAAPQVPILVIGDAGNEATARMAVQRGAQDYLLKGHLDSYLLPRTVGSMIERARITRALLQEKLQAQVTLSSLGDAVLSTDSFGTVSYLNPIAERLVGWTCAEARGIALDRVCHIVDAATRKIVPNPMLQAMREDKRASLKPNCILIRRDGAESAIEDSAAPIHDARGQVIGAVMVLRDVTAARALAERVSFLALHDSLTKLPNRTLFREHLQQAIALATRQIHQTGILFLDLDRFKHTNDTLGHAAGDGLLKAVAERLRGCVRASDTVCRQGGYEFLVLLPHITDRYQAEMVAMKILEALRAPYLIESHEVNVSASIGIAIYPDDGLEVEDLLKRADEAMYLAKHRGRDTWQVLEPGQHSRRVNVRGASSSA